jgi:hypothetical protein
MGVLIVFVACSGLRVLDRSQSDEPFLINVNSKWFYTCQRNVDSQIELIAIEEKRIVYILTYYTTLFELADILKVICDEDSLSLRT